MKTKIKKAITAIALAVICCTAPTCFSSKTYFPHSLIVHAENASSVSFDSATGTLTLNGNVVSEEVKAYAKNAAVKKVVAAEGTVLPSDCKNLFSEFKAESIDLSNAEAGNVTDMSFMFRYCDKLKTITFGNFNTSKCKYMQAMFQNCTALTSLDLSSFDTSNVVDMEAMFYWCYTMKELKINSFNTSSCTSMINMFTGCIGLTSLDLSSFNTSNVKYMGHMFMDCSSLKTLNLDNFDTSKCEDMLLLFYRCKNLTKLDLKNFNTSKVVSMCNMFGGCTALASLDISSFDTSSCWDMSDMFNGCSSLKEVDLRSFDTRNVLQIGSCFANCTSLKSLDLSSFDTSRVNYISWMFYNCTNLETIYVSNKWNTQNVMYGLGDMFENCPKLKGGNGTKYDAAYNNLKMACIDTVDKPGYFSALQSENTSVGEQVITPSKSKFSSEDILSLLRNMLNALKNKNQVTSTQKGTSDSDVTSTDNSNADKTSDVLNPASQENIDPVKDIDKDRDNDGYCDEFDFDPENEFDYSFLNNEIYCIGMYNMSDGFNYPLETDGSSVYVGKSFAGKEQHFRFVWCNRGYKIIPILNENTDKVLTAKDNGGSYTVTLESDKDMAEQLWEILPYRYADNGYGTEEGLLIRNKVRNKYSDSKAPLYLSHSNGLSLSSEKTYNEKVILYSSNDNWRRFGECYLNYLGWENTFKHESWIMENYFHNISVGISDENKLNQDGHTLLVYQSGGNFPKLRFCGVTMNGVCCEIMATYNALTIKNVPVDFFKLALEFEQNAVGIYYTLGEDGKWGSDPYKICNCLDAYNVSYTTINISDYATEAASSDIERNKKSTEYFLDSNLDKQYNYDYNVACQDYDKELASGICGILAYRFALGNVDPRYEGWKELLGNLMNGDEIFAPIHTFATIHENSGYLATYNRYSDLKNDKNPRRYQSTSDIMKEEEIGGHFMVGYVLK